VGYPRDVLPKTAKTTQIPGNHVAEIRAQTGLRGVAALWVVIFHYFQPIMLTSPASCLLGHGYLAVDLFFPLSGFVMALNYDSNFSVRITKREYKKFLARRFARIYPLYLVALLLASWLAFIGRLYLFGAHLRTIFVPNLLLIQNWGSWDSINEPSWSISAECFAYLLFPFLMLALSWRRWMPVAVMTIVVTALTLLDVTRLHASAGPKLLDLTRDGPSLVRCVTEFLLGILSYRFGTTPLGKRLKQSQMLGYFIPVSLLGLLAFRNSDLLVALLFPLFTLRLAGAPTVISRVLQSKPMEYLGLLSYSIYLLHFLMSPLIGVVDENARQHRLGHAHTYAVAASLVMLLPLSAASYHLLEVPTRRWVRNLFERRIDAPRAVKSAA
jgi:peptidoglycan/LPS O-acetylase OafA/YrhL